MCWRLQRGDAFWKQSDLNISTPAVTRPVSDDDKEVLKAALTEITQGQDGNAFGPVMEQVQYLITVVRYEEPIINNCKSALYMVYTVLQI